MIFTTKRFFIFIPCFIAFFIIVGSAFADPVVSEGQPANGFARMKFTWSKPVPFLARIVGKQLTLSFGRPIDSDYTNLLRDLSNYLEEPKVLNRGMTLVFPLKNEFGLNFNTRRNIVTVDLMDLQPKNKERRKVKPKKRGYYPVGVRTGRHKNYSRVVFDWDTKVPYSIKSKAGRLSIVFRKKGRISEKTLSSIAIKNINKIVGKVKDGTTRFYLDFVSSSKIQHFASGSKVIVDVFDTSVIKTALPKKLEKEVASPKRKITKNKPDTNKKENKKETIVKVSNDIKTNSLSLNRDLKKNDKLVNPRYSNGDTDSLRPTTTNFQRVPKIFIGLSSARAQTTDLQSPGPRNSNALGKEVVIRLDWDEPVAAAVFRRAGALWIVFDKSKSFDTGQIKDQSNGLILSADQIAAPRGTFLRLSTLSGVNPSIRRDGFAWVVELKNQKMSAKQIIEPKLQRTTRSGPRIFLPMVQAGDPLPFHDASVGDNIVIVPIIPISNGINKRHVFPEFSILPSLQGMVIQPKVDDMRVRTTSKGVQIYSISKLALSSPDPKAAATAKIRTLSSVKRIFPSDVWREARRDGIKNFNDTKQKLMTRIALSRGENRQKARYALAQYLFGLNFSYELLGVLKRIKSGNSLVENTPEFRLLRGGANFMAGRYTEANQDLSHPTLDDTDEGRFWRAINNASLGNTRDAAPILKESGRIILSYPRPIKMRLGLLIADTAVRENDVDLATNYLQMTSEEDPTPKEVDQLALVEGKLQQLVGEFDLASEAWKSVAEGEYRPAIADALLRRVELELTSKKLKIKDAIKLLEEARFSWRGDDLELKLLWKLGRLYLQDEDYRRGLRTLRSAGSYFGTHPDAPKIAEDMSNAFVTLYLKDIADSMPPYQAIALYEEFKELTPAGEQGDVVIQKLADRLAQVDLLDKAARLLMQQVDFRLQGEEKARVGARLATIRLINKQPAMAADAITRSDETDIPPFLEGQRRQLLARAYIDQGFENRALSVLDKDESRYADLLRAEIYWKNRKWPQATKILFRLVQSTEAKPGEKLDQQQATFIMNLAVSMALGGDTRGTDNLVSNYGSSMDKTLYKDAFRLIASRDSEGLIDANSVASKVKLVSNFTNFMARYNKSIKAGNLSSIN